jgi:predicted FMN-binding regulatory protein PaiB
MYYIADKNTDKNRPRPEDYEGADVDLLAEIGPAWYCMELMENDSVPAWKQFVISGKAEAEQIEQMINECSLLPLPTDYTQRLAERLKLAVPPIYVAQ